ncbi:MAG: ThiF family adenylyltransferase [Planctomycetota bacterium]|jgi:adenylyltransferase/sulfurtransferase|nr:ThiF family adenylyltransferase [Planctomycetota bacterium]
MTIRLSGDELNESSESRYHRQTIIEWWDQERVRNARILVVGAGALGNEILKILSLMGAGFLLVFDMDRIEHSNLSRAVLFRDGDEGEAKAEVAVRRLKELNPDVHAEARVQNLVHRAGLGLFAWADVVIAGVDNREARIFINGACANAGRRWVDGAIEGFSGIVRVFDPKEGACYECTMSETDRKLVAERRSCALLARDIVERGHVPTTAVTASLIGALEVQEAIKLLHGQPALVGEGLHIHGLWNETSRVKYPRRDDCTGHDRLGLLHPLGCGVADVSLGDLLEKAERELGAGTVLDLSRDVIVRLECPDCGAAAPGRAVLGELREKDAACPRCGTHRIVETAASIGRHGSVDLKSTPADLGLPPFDIIVARKGLDAQRAWLFDGDHKVALGELAPSWEGS